MRATGITSPNARSGVSATVIVVFGTCPLSHPPQFTLNRLEPAATDPEGTVVVEIPVDAGEGVRTAKDLTMWEQLSFAAFLQRHWADNQASAIYIYIYRSDR